MKNLGRNLKTLFIDLFSEKYDKIIHKLWYIVIFISGAIYVWNMRYEINSLENIKTPHIISLLWVMVLLMPLLSEIEIFGFKFKREIQKIENEVKDIKANILQSSSQINNYYPQPTLQKEEKETIEKQVNQIISSTDDFNVDDSIIYLFKVRNNLERELNKISFNMDPSNNQINRRYVSRNLKYLIDNNFINKPIFYALQEIFAICNKAVHSEEVSDEDYNFVKNTAPKCFSILKNLSEII